MVYDTAQFDAKQQMNLIKDPAKTEKKKEFLELIQASDDLLKHKSSELILQEKWPEKRIFTYKAALRSKRLAHLKSRFSKKTLESLDRENFFKPDGSS